jgi:hypothetical protein
MGGDFKIRWSGGTKILKSRPQIEGKNRAGLFSPVFPRADFKTTGFEISSIE